MVLVLFQIRKHQRSILILAIKNLNFHLQKQVWFAKIFSICNLFLIKFLTDVKSEVKDLIDEWYFDIIRDGSHLWCRNPNARNDESLPINDKSLAAIDIFKPRRMY